MIDTNGTVMSYETEQDSDGNPGFTNLDIEALQFVYGSEWCVHTVAFIGRTAADRQPNI